MTTYSEETQAIIAREEAYLAAVTRRHTRRVLAELKKGTSLEKALPLYAELLDMWKELGQVAESFEDCAPLLKPVPANLAQLVADAVEAYELKMARFQQKINFDLAFSRYKEVAAAQGRESEEALKLFAKVLEHTPPDIMKILTDKAQEMGLVPPASGYLESGEPVFTLDALAKQLGCSVDDLASCPIPESYTVDAASVHRVQ